MTHKKLSQQDIKNIRERLLEPLTGKIEDIKKQIGVESINMELEEKDNGCDQVESLRAKLSQLKPTRND